MVEAGGIQIIEKQAADAALLVTVFEKEVVIAPLFITRINVFAKGLAQIAGGTMPVNGIFFKAVVGG